MVTQKQVTDKYHQAAVCYCKYNKYMKEYSKLNRTLKRQQSEKKR